METVDNWVADGDIDEGEYMIATRKIKNIFEKTITSCCKKCRICNDNVCDDKEEESNGEGLEVVRGNNFKIDFIQNLPDEIKQNWKDKYGDGYITVYLEEESTRVFSINLRRVWEETTQDLLDNVRWFEDASTMEFEFKYIAPN